MRGFGEILAELRHGRALSQRALAKELKISQALLSCYENGSREPGLPFICKACDYFGVSADYLLGRTEDLTGRSAGFPAIASLNAVLQSSSTSVREAAADYIDAAARRVASAAEGTDSAASASAQEIEMAHALVRLYRNKTQDGNGE